MDPKTYATHLRGQSTTAQPIDGLAGRIIRGTKPEDFITLTDDPDRKLVMLVGPDGLAKLMGKNGHDMLVEIGYESNYIADKVAAGNQFKLVVFEAGNSSAAKLATWNNVIEIVSGVYPLVADKLLNQLATLKEIYLQYKELAFQHMENNIGFDLSEVDKLGKDDPRFMTYERYQQAADTPENARAFLYFAVHLRELFSGDGYTYTDNGNGGLGDRGLMEYIVPNMPIANLGNPEIVDIQVTLPNNNQPQGVNLMSVSRLKLINPPSFWNPAKVGEWYHPDFEAAMREGRAAGVIPATKRQERNMALVIDGQWDFTEKGRLPVTGMFADTTRLCERLIYGVLSGFYTDFMFTIDSHPPIAIHNSNYWKDENGNPPDTSLPVMMKLVDPATAKFEAIFVSGADSQYFYPVFNRKGTVEYAQHLEATNQNDGMIWVFTAHCQANTDGSALVPALAEVLVWASAALKIEPIFVWKGMLAGTDWFGPFKPCKEDPNHEQGGLQTVYLDMIARCNKIDIAGEAEDFCVLAGTYQIMDYYKGQTDVLNRIRFIGDCTSPIVPGSQAIADLHADMAAAGIQRIDHDQF